MNNNAAKPLPLERLRIASPCAASWDSMSGDERARHCRECGLKVYNLSAMTRREAEELVASTEGRLCARLYRRADGTVLTADCPVGWRAVRARASRRAAAGLTALLSLFGVAAGRQQQQPSPPQKKQEQEQRSNQINVRREPSDPTRAPLSGKVLDPLGADLPGAVVTLTDAATKERRTAVADEKGAFAFAALPAGTYEVWIGANGFEGLPLPLVLKSDEAVTLQATLEFYMLTGILSVMPYVPPPPGRVIKLEGITIRYEE